MNKTMNKALHNLVDAFFQWGDGSKNYIMLIKNKGRRIKNKLRIKKLSNEDLGFRVLGFRV